jgi:hypothetical protein
MFDTARLAGFFAAHGIWCVSDGATLTPMLGYEQADGQRAMTRFAADDLAAGVQAGQDALTANPNAATRAVLVVDGYLHLPAGRVDALIVEAVEYGGDAEVRSVHIGVPYRPQASPGGFAVHRPKILKVAGIADEQIAAVTQAFFAGVDSHDQAAPIWTATLDESV